MSRRFGVCIYVLLEARPALGKSPLASKHLVKGTIRPIGRSKARDVALDVRTAQYAFSDVIDPQTGDKTSAVASGVLSGFSFIARTPGALSRFASLRRANGERTLQPPGRPSLYLERGSTDDLASSTGKSRLGEIAALCRRAKVRS